MNTTGNSNLDIEQLEVHSDVQVKIIQCKHCDGTGSCSKGKEGSSCEVCIRRNLKWTLAFCFSRPRYGMVCSVCEGTGYNYIEPLTERLHNRTAPLLAIMIVYVALFMVWIMAALKSQYFSEILAFSSTLIGSITGYYFGGKKK
jgi:hypothetical protein